MKKPKNQRPDAPIILAFDPGRTQESFAYALLRDGVVVRYGLVRPIASLDHELFKTELDSFVDRMCALITECHPDAVVAERFMDRGGGGKGTTGEFINIMLGCLGVAASSSNLSLDLVMPSTWKNWLTRTYNTGRKGAVRNMLTQLRARWPEQINPKKRGQTRMVIHEGDAIGLALWRHEAPYPTRVGGIDRLIDSNTVKIDV